MRAHFASSPVLAAALLAVFCVGTTLPEGGSITYTAMAPARSPAIPANKIIFGLIALFGFVFLLSSAIVSFFLLIVPAQGISA
jgi:hypothetical protein